MLHRPFEEPAVQLFPFCGVNRVKVEIVFYFADMVAASVLATAIIGQTSNRDFELTGNEFDRGLRRALQIVGNESQKPESAQF